jgi:hypothetical protein
VRPAVADGGPAVCDEDVVDVEVGQPPETREVAIVPPAPAVHAVQRSRPHAQLAAACLDDGVAENEGAEGARSIGCCEEGGLPIGWKRAKPATAPPPVTASKPETSPSRVATAGCP